MAKYRVETDGGVYEVETEDPQPTEQATARNVFGEEVNRKDFRGNKYERGDRSAVGNVFERPAAAIRGGVQAAFKGENPIEGYIKGANVPEEVPTFQDLAIKKAQFTQSPALNALFGQGASAVGLMADTVTNPAETVSGGLSKLLGGTFIGKAVQGIVTKDRSLLPESITKILGTPGRVFGEANNARKALPQIENEIKAIQKNFGLEGTDDKYVITKINELKNRKRLDYNFRKDEFNLATKKEIAGLNAEYNNLKNVMVRGKAVDFADFIKTAGPQWVKKGSERYGLQLERFSKFVDDESPINAEEAYNFVTDNLRNVEQTGIESPVTSYLRSLQSKYKRLYEEYLERNIIDPTDPTYVSGPAWQNIPFKQLKTEMAGVYNHISPMLKSGRGVDQSDVASMQVARSWSELLKSKLTPDLRAEFEKLQSQYRPFAEAKGMMGKLFKPYTGELDVNQAAKVAEDFALNERNENVQRLMKYLQEGEAGFIEGIPGIGERAGELSQLGLKVNAIKGKIPVIRRSKELAQSMYKKELTNQIQELQKWQDAYKKLNAERTFNEQKIQKLFDVLKVGGALSGIGAGAIYGYEKLAR